MERVAALEQVVPQLIGMVQNLQAQFSQSVEILDAVVQNFGVEVIENTVIANRRQKAITKAEQEEAQMKALLEQGVLKSTPVVGERTIIVFKETKPDGTPTEPVSRVQFMFEQLQQQFRDELAGKGPGTTIKSPGGNDFTVQEVYEVIPQKPADATDPDASNNPANPEMGMKYDAANTGSVGPVLPPEAK